MGVVGRSETQRCMSFGCGGALAMLVARDARVTLKSCWTLLITNFDNICYQGYP
jgi:hypothetical protein